MKFLKLADEVLFNKELTSNEKIVYAVLLRRYNENKKCSYPSFEHISTETGISLSTVNRAIKRLSKLGYITINKKKSVLGNFNEYTNLKHLVSNKEENKEVPENKEPGNKVLNDLPIVSDMKESGVQLPIPNLEEEVTELNEYTKVHQAKISLVLKYCKVLSEKQKDIIGEFDLETLREAIRIFKKKKGRVFSFLLNLYIDIAEKNNIEVSDDIVRYLSGTYARLTTEEKETQQALKELELYGPYGLCI